MAVGENIDHFIKLNIGANNEVNELFIFAGKELILTVNLANINI